MPSARATPGCSTRRRRRRRAGGFPQLSNRLYFEAHRAVSGARTPGCAGPRQLAAGMEHVPAGLAGFQLRVRLNEHHEPPPCNQAGLLRAAARRTGLVRRACIAAPDRADRASCWCSCAAATTATNLLIPYSSAYYYEARPNIAMPRPDAASATGALALNADWALRAGGARHHRRACIVQRQVAFVPFAGTDDLSRSHFETQDSIELGQPRRRRAQLSLRLSRPAVRDAARDIRRALADRVHRCAAARLRGQPPRCPICRSRTSASRPSMSARRAS